MDYDGLIPLPQKGREKGKRKRLAIKYIYVIATWISLSAQPPGHPTEIEFHNQNCIFQ
jgi:hypothetical protein